MKLKPYNVTGERENTFVKKSAIIAFMISTTMFTARAQTLLVAQLMLWKCMDKRLNQGSTSFVNIA
ncbi:MAG TPA: hypothetical protein VD905_21745, partial [Flavobacteriales bacterium]|nr:hypothetical protein [Flavobacteriales bacterium]